MRFSARAERLAGFGDPPTTRNYRTEVQVSELIVKFLGRVGVDTIFGIPGAHILPVYDSLYDSPIRSVLAKYE